MIKIWVEDPATETTPVIWRGSITHIPSEHQVALDDLTTIVEVIKPYMKAIGIDPDAKQTT